MDHSFFVQPSHLVLHFDYIVRLRDYAVAIGDVLVHCVIEYGIRRCAVRV
jgi:hypothetical protein